MAVKLSSGQERFARLVAQATGLQLVTVRTWIAAEGGPDDNPLNIMSGGHVAHYITPQAAASRTVRLLRSGEHGYDRILTVARDPRSTPMDELAAIAQSDWEASGYRGGTLLQGAYASVTSRPGSTTATPVSSVLGAGIGGIPFFTPGLGTPLPKSFKPPGQNFVTDTVKDVAKWVGETAGKAFIYVAFTLLALVLIVLGSMRALGVGRGALRAQVASRPPGLSDEIPF